MNQFNWDQAFTLDFDLNDGLSKHAETTKRYLSQMKDMYQDQQVVEEILKNDDPLIYEFYELGCPERAGDLAFGTTMIHPGKIGNEYYMTKGHFHANMNRGEYYWGVEGEGRLIMMDQNRRVWSERMFPGSLHYIPGGVAHRVANIGYSVLSFAACWPSDAGHDYQVILENGFSASLQCVNGNPQLIEI